MAAGVLSWLNGMAPAGAMLAGGGAFGLWMPLSPHVARELGGL